MNKDEYVIISKWMIDLFSPINPQERTDYIKLLTFAYIYSYSRDDRNTYYGSQSTISEFIGSSERRVNEKLSELVKEGLIDKEEVKGTGFIKYCKFKVNTEAVNKRLSDRPIVCGTIDQLSVDHRPIVCGTIDQLSINSTFNSTFNSTVYNTSEFSNENLNQVKNESIKEDSVPLTEKKKDVDNLNGGGGAKEPKQPKNTGASKNFKDILRFIYSKPYPQDIKDKIAKWFDINLKGRFSVAQLEIKLDKLESYAGEDYNKMREIVNNTYENCYQNFFNNNYNSSAVKKDNANTPTYITQEEYEATVKRNKSY